MLAYNQPLSILHGSLISSTQSPSDEERLVIVRQAISEIVRCCKHDLHTVKREIHLFLLINTDIPWGQDLLENEAFGSLVGLVTKLSPKLYINIVNDHNLWPYLVETVPFLPPTALTIVVELSLGLKIFSPPTSASSAILSGLAISCASWARRWGGQEDKVILTKVLHKFAEETLKDANNGDELKAILLLNVLMVIKYLIVPTGVGMNDLAELYDFKKTTTTEEIDTVFSTEIESLLVIFMALVSNFSFDNWISLTEVSTVSVLQHSQLVPYWTGQFAPSNMQLLVGHMQAECRQLLQDSCRLMKLTQITEVLQIMSGFAQFYDRKMELNMDEMELQEIFQHLTISEGWKKQAYVDHLMEQDLEQVLKNEVQLDILLSNHETLNHHVSKLIGCLITSGQSLTDKQKELVSKVLSSLPDAELDETYGCFHAQYGLTTKLKRENFTQRFVSTLNRASGTSEESSVNREFLILVMEDGESVVRLLFEEAANNKGKVETCAGLLMLVVKVCQLVSEQYPLFSKLVTDFILCNENDARNKENVFSLTVSIVKLEPSFSQDIIEQFVKRSAADYEQNKLESAASLAEMVMVMLKEKVVIGCINNPLKLKVGVMFISLLNNHLTEVQYFKLKEVSLEIVRLLFRSSSSLKAKLFYFLKKENISYFAPVDSPVLLDHIHSNFWAGDTKLPSSPLLVSPGHLNSQLLACLPHLLKSEWQSLPLLLESICPATPALATIIDCLVLAMETTGPDLTYHMVLSLCSLATSMVSTSDCVATVGSILRELFILLDAARHDIKEIIWPCLHNTLGKYLSLHTARDTLVMEVLSMVVMNGRCGNRDIVVRMLQQAVL
eukprot:GFUD01035618.1.p1 GENE.GFUD01035618.1~~GFUD01035618.1.p1  ORF type:complete len:841 (+),score=215.49 GFUD01035618.1:56-2578(+)